MSRLSEIILNHKNLDELLALLKHYSVNAQFVAASVISQFDQINSEEPEDNEDAEEDDDDKKEIQCPPELLEDLKQYCARL